MFKLYVEFVPIRCRTCRRWGLKFLKLFGLSKAIAKVERLNARQYFHE